MPPKKAQPAPTASPEYPRSPSDSVPTMELLQSIEDRQLQTESTTRELSISISRIEQMFAEFLRTQAQSMNLRPSVNSAL
ncbi:hypothetical protein WAI453_005169 [Rhynchosporium graminicola]